MRRRGLGSKNRRGFTLILMIFMLTVLIGAAAFAVDFGQMYVYRNQLHAAADGAALAGAERIMDEAPSQGSDSAIWYAGKHTVAKVAVTLSAADVIPGTFTFGAGFVPNGGDWSTANAVRVTTRYTANFGFGRFFGYTTRALTATSDAAVGSVGATTCIKPVAIPYQALLDQLYPPGSKDPSWNLTPEDVKNLQGPHTPVQLKLGTDAVQGNFYLVNMGPYQYADGTLGTPNWGGDPIFEDRFAGSGTCNMTVGPGDWLQGKTGNAAGPMEKAYEDFCGVSITANGDYPCSSPKEVKVAMWATEDDSHCTPRCFLVKYTGVFVVTQYTKASGSGNLDGLWGYFSTMPTNGAFTTLPSPLKKLALVR